MGNAGLCLDATFGVCETLCEECDSGDDTTGRDMANVTVAKIVREESGSATGASRGRNKKDELIGGWKEADWKECEDVLFIRGERAFGWGRCLGVSCHFFFRKSKGYFGGSHVTCHHCAFAPRRSPWSWGVTTMFGSSAVRHATSLIFIFS